MTNKAAALPRPNRLNRRPIQPGLPLEQPSLPRLDDLVWPESNMPLYRRLQALGEKKSPTQLCIYGSSGSGRTAMLRAVCSQLYSLRRPAVYPIVYIDCNLPDSELQQMLSDLSGAEALTCLDNLEALQHRPHAQLAAAAWFDRLRASVLASSLPLHGREMLPDLHSRLHALASYHLQPLNAAQRREVLRRRVTHRQLCLPAASTEAIVHYLADHSGPEAAAALRAFEKVLAAAEAGRRAPSLALAKAVLLQDSPLR